MKQRYKIKTKNTTLPDDQVMRHKNFESVFAGYKAITSGLHRVPLYKNPKVFLSVFFAGTIAVLVYLAFREEDATKTVTDNKQPDTTQTVKQEPAPSYTHFDINPAKDQSFRTPDGAELFVPAGSILALNGKPCTGNVKLSYRKLTSAEVQSTGAPENYSASKQVEAIEVLVECNDEQAYIHSGKPLVVTWPWDPAIGKAATLKCWNQPVDTLWSEVAAAVKVGAKNENNGWDGFAVIENPGGPNEKVNGAGNENATKEVLRLKLNRSGRWVTGVTP